jgi:hypothetical protein
MLQDGVQREEKAAKTADFSGDKTDTMPCNQAKIADAAG